MFRVNLTSDKDTTINHAYYRVIFQTRRSTEQISTHEASSNHLKKSLNNPRFDSSDASVIRIILNYYDTYSRTVFAREKQISFISVSRERDGMDPVSPISCRSSHLDVMCPRESSRGQRYVRLFS